MPKLNQPEMDEAEIEAALNEDKTPDVSEISITNENALIVMAQAMVGIEKHLFALVYLENTRDPEKSGVTYVADVFRSIYDGSDPFTEVDEAVKAAAAANAKESENAG